MEKRVISKKKKHAQLYLIDITYFALINLLLQTVLVNGKVCKFIIPIVLFKFNLISNTAIKQFTFSLKNII